MKRSAPYYSPQDILRRKPSCLLPFAWRKNILDCFPCRNKRLYFLFPPQPKSPNSSDRTDTIATTLHTVCFIILLKWIAALRTEFRRFDPIFYIGAAGRTVYRHYGRFLASAVFAELAVVLCAAGRAEPFLLIGRLHSGYRTRLRSRIVGTDRVHTGAGTIIGC